MILPEFLIREKLIIQQDLCLNNRCKKALCTKCRDICPHHSITIEFLNHNPVIAESCSGCGLCIAACPAAAVSTPGNAYRQLTVKDEVADLFCTKYNKDGFVCLGLLNPYALVYIATKAAEVNVFVDGGMCDACNPGMAEHIKKFIFTANEFLLKLGKTGIKLSQKKRKESGDFTRRDLFVLCFAKVKEKMMNTVSFSEGEAPDFRELLLKSLTERDSDKAMGDAGPLFWGASVSGSCDLCGTCVRSCKNGALFIKANEENLKLELHHNQSKCIGCAACSLLCPKTAIRISNENSSMSVFSNFSSLSIASSDAIRCNNCGSLIIQGRELLCEKCLQKQNKRKLQSIY